MVPKSILLLLGILLLGLVVRVYKIWEMPMYGDELTMVYDTYSILKTGKDATGEKLPLTFAMGEGRPGGYIYASLPFVYLFGPSEWGVRSLSLLSGSGMIFLLYFIGKKLFDQKVGLIASFLAAISMWDIYLSRGGYEARFALFLATLGVTAFLYKKYLLWALAWGGALFTYPTFKLTLPLMFLVLTYFSGAVAVTKNKLFLISFFILVLFGALVARETLKGRSEERFLKINILSSSEMREQVIQKINNERSFSTLPDSQKPIFYNRPLHYGRLMLDSYMENLSPKFLFLRGDGNPRHNPGEFGMMYFVDFILLLAGLFFLAKDQKPKALFLIAWILLVPLATMFLGQAHALRNAFMLPPLILISSLAFTQLPKKISLILVVLTLTQLVFALQRVYFLAPNKFASFWSKEAKVESLIALGAKDYTLSTKIDNIEYAYPVYAKIDPNLVINQYGKYPKVYGHVVIADP